MPKEEKKTRVHGQFMQSAACPARLLDLQESHTQLINVDHLSSATALPVVRLRVSSTVVRQS